MTDSTLPPMNECHRRSIRLREYDYRLPGAYFITICTHEKALLFADTINGKIQLNEYGAIVEEEWLRSAEMRREIDPDVFTVMPNHFHGIVFIRGDPGELPLESIATPGDEWAHGHAPLQESNESQQRPTRSKNHITQRLQRKSQSLGAFVGGFKASVTTRINRLRGTPRMPVWQRNYHEHIIRNEKSYFNIRRYIKENIRHWLNDPENPHSVSEAAFTEHPGLIVDADRGILMP